MSNQREKKILLRTFFEEKDEAIEEERIIKGVYRENIGMRRETNVKLYKFFRFTNFEGQVHLLKTIRM